MELSLAQWLTPWEFSPFLVFLFLCSGVLFLRGTFARKINKIRQAMFWIGFVMLYLGLHTHVDYFAERVFFIHRLQHLFLHHLAPLLVMASFPGQVMRAGMPLVWRKWLNQCRQTRIGRDLEYLLTHKIFVPFMFVFLVLVWLIPSVQFYSMLDWRLYRLMNWSVVFSGFLYWNLILDRRPYLPSPLQATTPFARRWELWNKPGSPAVMSVAGRIWSPVFTMLPQMIVGGLIAFASTDIYPLFDLCGRAMNVTALQDQSLGGVIMWVPAAIVETFGTLSAILTWLRLSAQGRLNGLDLSPEANRRGSVQAQHSINLENNIELQSQM